MGLDDRIITSPNMNFIPEFPVIDRSGLFIRADGTWGPHDYTRWPQAYSSKNLHHICIPRLPSMGMLSEAQEEDSLDHHPILYSDLDEEVWERSGEYTLSSGETLITGQYRRDTIETLVRCFHLHKQRAISRYSTTEYKDASDYKLVAILSSLGEKVIERMNAVAEPFYASRTTARELQRIILELIGFSNLVSVVRPRLRNPTFNATDTLPYRGVFCSTAHCLQDFFRIGIPVWYIRHTSSLSPSTKIIHVVDAFPLTSCIVVDRVQYGGKPVFIGDIRVDTDLRSPYGQVIAEPAMSELLASMRVHSRTDDPTPVRISNQSALDTSPSNPIAQSQPTQSTKREQNDSGTNSRPSKRTRHNKDESRSQKHAPSGSLLFSIPDGLYPGQRDMPPIARHWLKAITKVGLITKRRPEETAKYHHPPPFLFCHPNPERLARYYHNYIRIERFLRQRLKEGSLFGDQSYTIKQWRDILYGDYHQSGDIDDRAASSLVRTLDVTLPPSQSPQPELQSSSRLHDRKKRGKRAEVRVTLSIQGECPSYSSDMVAKWWLTGEDVAIEDVKSNRRLRETVLFDAHGMGFILDVWTVDYHLIPRSGLSSDAVHDRHLLLASIYNGIVDGRDYKISTSGMMHLWTDKPDSNCLESFLRLVKDWPDCPKSLLITDIQHCTEAEKDSMYEQLTAFFVNKCIDVLDRLPIVPCYLKE